MKIEFETDYLKSKKIVRMQKVGADKLVTSGDCTVTGHTGNSFFANLSVNEGGRYINDCTIKCMY
jgi:hypothetical protein